MQINEQNNIYDIIDRWEKEENNITVKRAYECIRTLEESDQPSGCARVYALMARDRWKHQRRFDPMIRNWLQKAEELDDTVPLLQQLRPMERIDSIQENILDTQLTPLRETDPASARYRVAEQLREQCRQMIQYLDDTLDTWNPEELTVDFLNEVENEHLRELPFLLENIKQACERLASSTQTYMDTASGSFYSPEAVREIKEAISHVEQLKEKWNEASSSLTKVGEEYTDPLEELNDMIGLHGVKSRVHNMYHYLQYQKRRKEQGYQWKDERSLHMILTGNPGTGKTMLARLLAKIYHQLGLLQRDEVLETDRSRLVGSYVGQTEEKTMALIKEAVGGVLFIDEAYSLKREGMAGNDFGQTAIDTLVSAMTSGEYAGTFAVILAGYPEEMRQFLHANPGLRSRFPESNHIHLPDYSMDELMEIGEKVALENDFFLSEESKRVLEERIEKEQVDETFGNGRTVKNIVLDSIFQKGAAIGNQDYIGIDDFSLLTAGDIEEPEGEQPKDKRSAVQQLDDFIGLNHVKQEMKKLASFIRVQQQRREEGAPTVPIQLHTVFSGPPGTGKTTLAQVYAGILKEYGFLKRGHCIVAGRSDLVAEYVGQTAAKTKRKVREALGGVLFIDEAYALMSSSRSDFGREALDTLVEEMTKHDENLVVVLSGYPDPMKQLLEMNPGLESRFKKTFYFPPYTPEDLAEITERSVERFGYHFEPEARELLESRYAVSNTDGNARLAEDVAEEIFQQQAFRLFQSEKNDEDLHELTAEDVKHAIEVRVKSEGEEGHEERSYTN
ncbi:AAA family ATPase [Marinococcus halophilus]|uniref:AAA family ATPase n=1 Tax=Marinococcus halophilus TaxID=1371 RepID=UPI0009A6A7A9|nr:AAA family ATPase [Marinococcus halophilus]